MVPLFSGENNKSNVKNSYRYGEMAGRAIGVQRINRSRENSLRTSDVTNNRVR
jgi:hypothetical protein